MGLVLNEEQAFLRDDARRFFAERAPVAALRRLRDSADATGFSREVWAEMCQLGHAGIVFPEEYGGSGFGYLGLGLVLMEAGRTLAATPLVSTVLLSGSAILLGGSPAMQAAVLPAVARGELILAFAHEEGHHHHPTRIATRAERRGEGWVLNGRKTFVLDGHVADRLVVVARTAGAPEDAAGLTLFLVPAEAAGIGRTRLSLVDSRNAALVTLDNVAVGGEAVIGTPDQGSELLEQVLDRARIGLAAEMQGTAEEAFARTIAYLKERQQFGVPIGSFQALKHRAAEMFAELELTRSTVLDALSAIDERRNDIRAAASLAKARAGDTLFTVSNEGVQMHGGIGMTDDHEIGFFLKRARVTQQLLGTSAFHRDRWARLEGF